MVALLAAAVVSLASTAWSSSGERGSTRGGQTGAAGQRGAFAWLRPASAPAGWVGATIASGGATLFYPSSWTPIPGDRGTVTASLRDGAGRYRGYLNLTPQQGAEQLAGWAAFRTRRNSADGDQRTRTVAAGEGLRFSGAHGSCVIDEYLSRVDSNPYREVACIVAGARFTNVFVGAALVSDWPSLGPVIERAASAVIAR